MECKMEKTTEKRPRRTFTEEFKKQMVDLYNAGKSRAEIVREYNLQHLHWIPGLVELIKPVHRRRQITGVTLKMNL